MKIGNREFDIKNGAYIMGILNVTPDSFSDGGKFYSVDNALFHVEKMIEAGVDIIDVGGESTRPGHIQISDQEEIDRVLPVIEKIKNNFDIPVSLDSYKSEVINALKTNIDLVNDIWGLKYDPKMASLISETGLPCCLMHNRKKLDYTDFWNDFISDMKETINIAKKSGISDDKIILDAGVGFQKEYEHNLIAVNRADELCKLGYPVLIATSKKRFIGASTGKETENRTAGTLATTVIGLMKGATFFRVHDVDENVDAIKVTKSVLEERQWIR